MRLRAYRFSRPGCFFDFMKEIASKQTFPNMLGQIPAIKWPRKDWTSPANGALLLGRGPRPKGAGLAMVQQTVDAAAIEAEIGHIRSLGIEALRKRRRLLFGASPPKGLTKDIIARMIACREQRRDGRFITLISRQRDSALARLLLKTAETTLPAYRNVECGRLLSGRFFMQRPFYDLRRDDCLLTQQFYPVQGDPSAAAARPVGRVYRHVRCLVHHC